MALYDVPAPAKINLFLHVVGRRPDGYHELQTAFRFIDLCDRLDFDLRRDGRIERSGDSVPGLAPENDLVIKAATALQQATGTAMGAEIRYTKRIPSGAGLGGGSSDAATTLIALNRLWNTRLDRSALIELARPLGADVPIFIFGRPAFAEGVGDVFTEITLPERAYVVLRPQGSVATADVFGDPNLTRDSEPVKISVFADWQTVGSAQNDEKSPVLGNRLFGRNDLQPVVLARHEGIQKLASTLQKQGFRARMTGSGNCFFVEFNTLQQATRARQEISSKMLGGSQKGHGVTINTNVSFDSAQAVVGNIWACPGLFEHPLQHW